MSNPPDNLRLRVLLEQSITTANAAITERDHLKAVNAELLEALQNLANIMIAFEDDGSKHAFQAAKAAIAKALGESS